MSNMSEEADWEVWQTRTGWQVWTAKENEEETARSYFHHSLPINHHALEEWFAARRAGPDAYERWREKKLGHMASLRLMTTWREDLDPVRPTWSKAYLDLLEAQLRGKSV